MGLFSKMRDLTGSVSKELLSEGLLGRGIIIGVEQTSVSTGVDFDPSHVCEFTVEVALDNKPRYTATCRQAVKATIMPQLMAPAVTVAVRVDAGDHSRIALSPGEAQPTVTMAAAGSGDPKVGSAARILSEGQACTAVIVQCQPLGMRNPAGDDMYAFALTMMASGVAPYQIQVSNPVPARPRCRCCTRARPSRPSGCPTATNAKSRSIGRRHSPTFHDRRLTPTSPAVGRTAPAHRSIHRNRTNSSRRQLMVLVTGNWKLWMVGMAASLAIFAVLFFTVIKPSSDTANQAVKSGLQQSQPNQAQKQITNAGE